MLGGIRHITRLAVLSAALVPAPSQADRALADLGGETLRLFATCTGRLSAKLEYQWLIGDPASDITEAQRNSMADLLEAVAPDGSGSLVMTYRIDAKIAYRQLLERARFAPDPADAQWAEARADAILAPCTAMLLA